MASQCRQKRPLRRHATRVPLPSPGSFQRSASEAALLTAFSTLCAFELSGPPRVKWSDSNYGFSSEEDCHGQQVNDKLTCCGLKSITMAAQMPAAHDHYQVALHLRPPLAQGSAAACTRLCKYSPTIAVGQAARVQIASQGSPLWCTCRDLRAGWAEAGEDITYTRCREN